MRITGNAGRAAYMRMHVRRLEGEEIAKVDLAIAKHLQDELLSFDPGTGKLHITELGKLSLCEIGTIH